MGTYKYRSYIILDCWFKFGLVDISPDMRRRSVCSIWVLTEGLCLEVNFEVQLRIDSSRPSIC